MTAIDEAARPARAADVPEVVALVEHAIEELTPLRGGAIWSRREARTPPFALDLGAEIPSPDHQLIVGTIDDAVVGYASARRETLHDGTALAVLSDVYVLPDARGVGVGEAMLDLIIGWADQLGCIGIDSLALPGDRNTKNFFESFGLVARAILVHRSLGER